MASRASQPGKSWAAENLLVTAIALCSSDIPRHQGANGEETHTPRTVDLIDVRRYFHMIDLVSFSAGATEDLEIARVIKLFSLVRREPVANRTRAEPNLRKAPWGVSCDSVSALLRGAIALW